MIMFTCNKIYIIIISFFHKISQSQSSAGSNMNNIKLMTKPEAGAHYDDISLLSIDTVFVLLAFGLIGLIVLAILKNILLIKPEETFGECELVRIHGGESRMKKLCCESEKLTIVLDQDGELRIQGSPRRRKKPVLFKGHLINNNKRFKQD